MFSVLINNLYYYGILTILSLFLQKFNHSDPRGGGGGGKKRGGGKEEGERGREEEGRGEEKGKRKEKESVTYYKD